MIKMKVHLNSGKIVEIEVTEQFSKKMHDWINCATTSDSVYNTDFKNGDKVCIFKRSIEYIEFVKIDESQENINE